MDIDELMKNLFMAVEIHLYRETYKRFDDKLDKEEFIRLKNDGLYGIHIEKNALVICTELTNVLNELIKIPKLEKYQIAIIENKILDEYQSLYKTKNTSLKEFFEAEDEMTIEESKSIYELTYKAKIEIQIELLKQRYEERLREYYKSIFNALVGGIIGAIMGMLIKK